MKFFACFVLANIIAINITISQQQGAAINNTGAAADPSAILDVASTVAGVLMPRMTTAERDLIGSPAQGLLIFNITTNCLDIYISPLWQSIYCGCIPPDSPTAGVNIPQQTEITWNWNPVTGATGYKYNTVNDYNTSTDNGANISFTQMSLTCNTSYTLFVWSYNACGNSSAAILNEITSSCPVCGTFNVNFTYKGSSVTYGTVKGSYNNGQYCWMDRNIGATAVATAINHVAGYGDLFQWGRLDDGHQNRTSATTTILSSNDIPGHSDFIISQNSPYDWRSPQNSALWQGVIGANNPCPAGWRLPTENEFNNEISGWTQQNTTGAIASPIKLPAAGYRDNHHNGTLFHAGSFGSYWSSTLSYSLARNVSIGSSNANMNLNSQSFGMSVRCIKD